MKKSAFGFAVLLMLFGVNANATVITFDEIAHTEAILTSLEYGGFQFASQHFHTHGCGHPGQEGQVAGFASNDSTYLGYESGRGSPITMARTDGGLFSLLSLDVSEFYAYDPPSRPDAHFLVFTGYTASAGTITHSINLDGMRDGPGGVADFEHFLLPESFQNLISLTFEGLRLDGGDGGIAIDNLEYVVSSVPEPATLSLFGLGAIGFAAARRKRRIGFAGVRAR